MNTKTTMAALVAAFALAASIFAAAPAITARQPVIADPLVDAFLKPSADARPGTYWYWLNGNMTQEGITADLEAMAAAGIGSPMIYSVVVGPPAGKTRFGSAEHNALMLHAAKEADRLGLQLACHNADGWSSSGGPWIKPEDGMGMVTWSEARASGPGLSTITLETPANHAGFYRDLAVFAVACPEGASANDPMDGARLTSSVAVPKERLDALLHPLTPVSDRWGVSLASGMSRFEIELAKPALVRGVEFTGGGPRPAVRVFASEDGKNFRPAFEVPSGFWLYGGRKWEHCAFAPVMAKWLRIELTPVQSFSLAGLRVTDLDRIKAWPVKACFNGFGDIAAADLINPSGSTAPKVVDLSGKMDEKGAIRWEVPDGVWRILRIGHTITGQKNDTATGAGCGLEVDKFSKEALTRHFNAWLGKRLDDFGPLAGKSVAWTHVASWEVGPQNWSGNFPTEFAARRGYDLRSFLPVFAGVPVGGAAVAERFLWDVRRTHSELVAENYFGHFRELANARGLRFSAEAFSVVAPAMGFDHLYAQCMSDMPMTEFWAGRFDHVPEAEALRLPNNFHETREATSAAHATGRPFVGAEAFTASPKSGRWLGHPGAFKEQGDRMFCHGVNRFDFHVYAHQPWNDKFPGMTWPYGSMFDRNNTWFFEGKAWYDYLTRCQALLQSGRFVADVAYFPGGHGPNLEPQAVRLTQFSERLPAGYDFDAIPEHLLLQAHVEEGCLVLPSGMSYRLLALGDVPLMTAAVANKLRELVREGAVVLGPRPVRSPSLADLPKGDQTVAAVADELWEASDKGHRVTGKGSVYWGMNPGDVLAAMGVAPDCELPQGTRDPMDKNWIHRRTSDADIYFVRNLSSDSSAFAAVFRASGKIPEIWNPETGAMEDAGWWWSTADKRVSVRLNLEPKGSLFVVFRKPIGHANPVASVRRNGKDASGDIDVEMRVEKSGRASLISRAGGSFELALADGSAASLKAGPPPEPVVLQGPWELSFPPQFAYGDRLPPAVTLDTLACWTAHADERIRHFSGTGIYRKKFQAQKPVPGQRVLLDLGRVEVLARVRLNGHDLGTLWKPPFRVDITPILQEGENQLEVRVTNLWVNRLIGDERRPALLEFDERGALKGWPTWLQQGEQPPDTGRVTFATWKHYSESDPLLPSGWLGPVTLQFSVTEKLQ